jgi:type I restriction enzyme S subunit
VSDWPTVSVGDVSTVITKGTTPTTLGARFQVRGINFVKVESLESGRIDHGKLAYIDDETHALLRRSALQQHDVLFSIAGTIGRTARVGETDLPANTNQAVAIIRPNLETVDQDFLFYCLNDTGRIAAAQSRVVQSVQQNLSLAELGNVEIPLPPIEEQRGIATTLSALDDKLASNRRSQDIGQRLLRAVIKSAIDESAGPVGRLDDYCDLVKDGVSVDELDPNESYIGLEHMPRGSLFLGEWSTADGLGSNKSRFREGDVLFGKLRPYFKKVGVAPIAGVCSTDVLVLRPKRDVDRALVAIVASSDALIDGDRPRGR